jgi:hypothetical protein
MRHFKLSVAITIDHRFVLALALGLIVVLYIVLRK